MKAIIKKLMAILAILMFVGGAFQAKAQFVFSWMQDMDGKGITIITSPTITNKQTTPVALDFYTSYHCDFTINNDTLSIERQNILPSGPGAGTAYYAGPIEIGNSSELITFEVRVNPTAKDGSAENIFNIMINGISLSQTITADINNPYSSFSYTHFEPISSIQFDYSICAVSDTSETGIGVSMLNITAVPEPSTTSLLIFSSMIVVSIIYIRRHKHQL